MPGDTLQTVIAEMRKQAQRAEDIRHVRDNPYDDRSMELTVEAKVLRQWADRLAHVSEPPRQERPTDEADTTHR